LGHEEPHALNTKQVRFGQFQLVWHQQYAVIVPPYLNSWQTLLLANGIFERDDHRKSCFYCIYQLKYRKQKGKTGRRIYHVPPYMENRLSLHYAPINYSDLDKHQHSRLYSLLLVDLV